MPEPIAVYWIALQYVSLSDRDYVEPAVEVALWVGSRACDDFLISLPVRCAILLMARVITFSFAPAWAGVEP
jgi:hypothetical protein